MTFLSIVKVIVIHTPRLFRNSVICSVFGQLSHMVYKILQKVTVFILFTFHLLINTVS